MKRFLLFLLPLWIFSWIGLTSHNESYLGHYSSGGRANAGQDRTGSPVSVSGGSTCSACHGGGSFGPSVSVVVRDQNNQVVSTYTPNENYTVEYTVTASSGNPKYAMQSVALLSNNANAGNFQAALTANSRISSLGGRQYPEQQGVSNTGVFHFDWQAPSAGSGQVRFFTVGLACNGTGGTSGDQATSSMQTTLNEMVSTSIDYGASVFCDNENDPTPTINGNQGGTFSSTTSGLNINSVNGQIDLSASTPGAYTVEYAHNDGTETFNLEIRASISVTQTDEICEGDSVFIAGTYRFDAGVFTEVLTRTNGCDSIVETTLTVNPTYYVLDTTVICFGDSALINGEYQSEEGTYADTSQTVNSCDSIVGAYLRVLPEITSTNVETLCLGDSIFFGGEYIFEGGTYSDTLTAANGCDSVDFLIAAFIDIDTDIFYNDSVLSVGPFYQFYQWFDCETGEAITDETGSSFKATENGSYKCVFGVLGCMDSTDCFIVDDLNTGELSADLFKIYPNPATYNIQIDLSDKVGQADVEIWNIRGQKIISKRLDDSKTIQLFDLSTGVYMIHVKTDIGNYVQRLIIE